MKKNLLALAIAGAFVAPVAMADNANVTVYGIADASYENIDSGDTTAGVSGVTNNKISSNQSRIGFKGTEDLGGGLKAIFQVERQVDLDAASGPATSARNTFVGLAGDSWGSVTLGRNDSSYKSATRGYDVFLDHIADNRNLMGTGNSAFDGRYSDTARYDSPDMSGFKVSASYIASAENNTVSTADVKARGESLSGTYATGPFSVAAAYQKHVFGSTAGNTITPVAGVPAGLTDEKAWKVGGGYKMDQFGVNAVYEKTTDSLGNAANGRGHKAYYLAGTFNATANDQIKAAYTKAQKKQDGNLADSAAKQWSIGVDHSMSKRTTVYAMYTKLDNDSAANYGLSTASTGGSATGLGNGADPKAFSIGMKHAF